MVLLSYDKKVRGGNKLNSQIKSLVDKILAITSKSIYDPNAKTTDNQTVKQYEEQIDQLIYKLYNLTPKEIKNVKKTDEITIIN